MLQTILMQESAGGGFSGIIMIVLIFVIFYFFMIRPQSKKQKELKKAREALTVNDKVVTAGGVYGRIKEVKDTYFSVEIAPGVSVRIDKNNVFPATPETTTPEKK